MLLRHDDVIRSPAAFPATIVMPPRDAADPARDHDLCAVLERFVERVDAETGALVRLNDDGRPAATLAAVGLRALDTLALDRLVAAARAAQGARRRATDRRTLIGLTAAGSRERAIHVTIPGEGGDRFLLVGFYAAGHAISETAATAAAERQAAMIDDYLRLWCRHRADRAHLAGLTAALDLFKLAVFVLDREGDIVFANRAAADVLAQADGLRRHERTIAATDLGCALRLQVAIRHVAAEARDGARRRAPVLSLTRRGGQRALVCTILPVTSPDAEREPDAAAVICYVLDPGADFGRVVTPVCRLHALSPVETRLACLLASGMTLSEAAATMRIKEQTARAYLKQVFIKTGTNRQADLIRVLLTSVAHIYGDIEPTAL